MRKIPYILFLALCLCLCACSAPSEGAENADMALLELNIYHGDESCENIISDTVYVPELSPEHLMAALHTMGALSEEVPVKSFLMDKTGLIRLDLGGEFAAQINSMGTSGEYIMMGSLVNTFLDAYDASGLMLQVDGKILETGHSLYDWTLGRFD